MSQLKLIFPKQYVKANDGVILTHTWWVEVQLRCQQQHKTIAHAKDRSPRRRRKIPLPLANEDGLPTGGSH